MYLQIYISSFFVTPGVSVTSRAMPRPGFSVLPAFLHLLCHSLVTQVSLLNCLLLALRAGTVAFIFLSSGWHMKFVLHILFAEWTEV